MNEEKNKELVKRIAGLVKENKQLTNQILELSKLNDKLTDEYESLKEGIKEYSKVSAKSLKFKMATVLFVDITGFEDISKQGNPNTLIDELDTIFIHFDAISEKYNIEKIKTIGDSYMCAGGVPVKNNTNPLDVVLAALEIQQCMNDMQTKCEKEGKSFWQFRIGIHTGPVTATTMGTKKVSYSLKGDTVNIASRFQSASEIGKINISVMTYELIKEYFTCDYHGILPVKYKDDHEMFYVRRIKKAYSVERKGKVPNDIFNVKYKLRQFADIQEIFLDKLEKELPSFLYYHNAKHTIDVITQVELIGWGEGVTDKELLILKTAALFHDMGQIQGAKNHEEKSCEYAEKLLTKFNYTKQEIELINNIIMATQLPPTPKTLLQKIICDSDLDYLGRSDFIPVSDTLFKELKEQNIITSLNEWNKLQVKFLSGHAYFTNTAKNLREVNKQDQIDRISDLIH